MSWGARYDLAAKVEQFFDQAHQQTGVDGGQFVAGPDGAGRLRDKVNTGNTAGTGVPKGMVDVGNISLHGRKVAHNSDGSISTVRTISVGVDAGEVLLPTVIDGKVVSNDAAIAHYKATGENLGTFDTPANADAYSVLLHNEQAKEYGAGGTGAPASTPGGGTDAAKAIQQKLNAAGANLKVDGIIGPKTKAAIVALQNSLGVKADGVFGPKTAAALANKKGKPVAKQSAPTPKPASSPGGLGPGKIISNEERVKKLEADCAGLKGSALDNCRKLRGLK